MVLLGARAVTRAQAPAAPERAHPEVVASLDPCVPVDAGQFHRLLDIELGDDVRYRAEGEAGPGATRIAVACNADGIVLSLRDGVTRKDMERVLRPEPLRQRSGARLLALAVAEFVVASWIELDVQPEPAVEPVGPPPSPVQRRGVARTVRRRVPAMAPPAAEPALDLAAAFTTQVWSSHDGVLLGGQLRLLHRANGHLAWSIAADFDLTRLTSNQGEIELATSSAAVVMLLYLPLGDVDIYAGGGGRVGAVRMEGVVEGRPELLGRGFLAPFAGPLLFVRSALEVARGLGIALDLEAGLVTLEAAALDEANQPLLTFEGVWIRAGLGVWAAF